MIDTATGDAIETDGNRIPEDVATLFASRLAEATKLDPSNAPFPMDAQQGRQHQMGRRDVLEWIHDMLNLADRPLEPTGSATLVDPGLAGLLNQLLEQTRVREAAPDALHPRVRLPVRADLANSYEMGRRETLLWVVEMLDLPG